MSEQTNLAIGAFAVLVAALGLSYTWYRTHLSDQRELTREVYAPILADFATWSKDERYFRTWTQLKATKPDLTQHVPRDLRGMLDTVESVFEDIPNLTLRVRKLANEATARLGQRFKNKTGILGEILVGIVATSDHQASRWLSLGDVWIAKKSIEEYAMAWVEKDYPGSKCDLSVQCSDKRVGDSREADVLAKEVFSILASDTDAQEIRKRLNRARKIESEIRRRIDQEMEISYTSWVRHRLSWQRFPRSAQPRLKIKSR